MDAFVEVVNPDGTQDRFPIEGAQVTLGKSGSAQISVPAARELELEHLLLAPRGKEGCWVSTSQGALTPTMLKGKPFTSGIVPWGSEFSIGRLRIRVTNKRASKDDKEGGVSPVLLVALVVVVGGGAWVMFGKQQAEGIPSGEGIEPPALFSEEPGACPEGNREVGERAVQTEFRAHARGDRLNYDLRDGVRSVMLYKQAAACYREARNTDKATEMDALGADLQETVQAEYAARRLRLHHALQTEDWERAFVETRALSRLVDHLDDENEYVVWLDRTRRIVQGRWDKERERRE